MFNAFPVAKSGNELSADSSDISLSTRDFPAALLRRRRFLTFSRLFFISSISSSLANSNSFSIQSLWLAFEHFERASTWWLPDLPPSTLPALLSSPHFCGGSSPPRCALQPAGLPALELLLRLQLHPLRLKLFDMLLVPLAH